MDTPTGPLDVTGTDDVQNAIESTNGTGGSSKPSWEIYYLGIAEAASKRSSCERSKVGACVVKNNRVVALGYNDAPAGQPGCDACPRRTSSVPPGSSYDDGPGRCVAVHAEANALLYCDREDLVGATLYITRPACAACSKLIKAAGIKRVKTPEPYEDWPNLEMPEQEEDPIGRAQELITESVRKLRELWPVEDWHGQAKETP